MKKYSKSPDISKSQRNKKVKKESSSSEEEIEIERIKRDPQEVIEHFSSMALMKNEIKLDDYINSAVYISNLMKEININEKRENRDKIPNPKKILKYPWLISDNPFKEDYKFILSLFYKILKEKEINTLIYDKIKENQGTEELVSASLHYLFSGLTEKKRIEICFDLDNKTNKKLIKKEKELTKFISEWKIKLSKKLNKEINDIILVNPKEIKGKFSLDLFQNTIDVKGIIDKLKSFDEIGDMEEKPLIEACQLSLEIFDQDENILNNEWQKNGERGGEDYFPPIGWSGYGINIQETLDERDDDDSFYNFDKDGYFAVAYLGISNTYNNTKNNNFLNKNSLVKISNEQKYCNAKDIKNPSKKCGSGVYLFTNPQIAENTAGIIDVDGIRYKILLMCKVNPNKIRKPEGFKDCWILNPCDIKPYKILIKKIFLSAMAGSSQNEIEIFKEASNFFKEILNNKDTSFYERNNTGYSDDEYVINLYTTSHFRYINNYLKYGKMYKDKNEDNHYTEDQIRSWIYCLHKALTTNKSNVPKNCTVYRGVNRKFPEQMRVGKIFIFREFISTTEDLELAKRLAGDGTLFIIKIENNINPYNYCAKLDDLSNFKSEKEILITSHCIFEITKKINRSENNNEIYDIVYLTCHGYQGVQSISHQKKNLIKNYSLIN